jgi:hypothetical protein
VAEVAEEMKRIPKTLQLLAHTITVCVVSRRDWEALTDTYPEMEDDQAYSVYGENRIILLRTSRTQMLHSLYHELFHFVLYYMNHPALSVAHPLARQPCTMMTISAIRMQIFTTRLMSFIRRHSKIERVARIVLLRVPAKF